MLISTALLASIVLCCSSTNLLVCKLTMSRGQRLQDPKSLSWLNLTR